MSSQTLWTVLNFNSLVLAFLLMMFALWARPQWWPPMLTLFAGLLIGFMAPRTEEIIFDVPNPAAALFAFVPALLGTYLGVLIQRTSRAPRVEPTG
jgi:hypothetical protein